MPSDAPHSIAYATAERLTRELHDLIRRGHGDSDEAEAIRDALDSPWVALTDAERGRLGELSAALNREAEGPR